MRISLAVMVCLSALGMGSLGCEPVRTLVESKRLEGTFNGRPWKAVSGTSERFTEASNRILSTLSDEEQETCEPQGTEKLVVEIPFKPGIYELDLSLKVHFVFSGGKDDLAATDGEILVHEVTETTIKGGLYAIYNGNPNYEVSGQFTIDRCPF